MNQSERRRRRNPAPSSERKEGRRRTGGDSDQSQNFRVAIRVRPPLDRELHGEVPFVNTVCVDDEGRHISVSEHISQMVDEGGHLHPENRGRAVGFTFDNVYGPRTPQEVVYEHTARPLVDSALEGYNATIFAYGQTGTGKTFTMEGFSDPSNPERRGIIPRSIEQIFDHINANASPRTRFLVRASYLQIYNEQISDLLKPERTNLTIREDPRKGVFVENLSEWVVRNPAEIYGLIQRGSQVRAVGATKMNEMSSRSHALFIIIVEQSETAYINEQGEVASFEEISREMRRQRLSKEEAMGRLQSMARQTFKVGKLNLVDLAGSERVRLSGATGQRLQESRKINQSLSALGNVISALTDPRGRAHIPYRDSRLTRILEDSLGGNCKTVMIAMVSPALEAMQETISTVKFAHRAKAIKNEAKVNEDLDQKSLLIKYERELKKLRADLAERNRTVVDKRRLLELDEKRKQAEADRMLAIKALEERSKEFMNEKSQKKQLEERIAMLTSRMIHYQNQNSENMRILVQEQQEKMRKDYEDKLANLERERETIEEEKAQVDRYKQLLLKQRDIMIALTQRLNERDEQIMALQDEVDSFDKIQRDLEENVDRKRDKIFRLQRTVLEMAQQGKVLTHEELREIMQGAQAEDEQRAHKGGKREEDEDDEDDVVMELTQVVEEQKIEIDELKRAVVEARRISPPSFPSHPSDHMLRSEEVASLRSRCDALASERQAIQTIMESKVSVLVQSVAHATSLLLERGSSDPQTFEGLARDVGTLQRLVNASVRAMQAASSSA